MSLRVDILDLKIGKVLYKDYSQGTSPQVQEFDINIDQKYNDITDLKQLITLIMAKALMNTTISKLTNFEMDKLTKGLSEKLLSSTNLLPAGSGAAVTKTLESLGKAMKLPFGSQEE
ncbi:MAG: hypothetical protein ABH883_06080 [Candidatus Omnitrophota bacterium]